MKLSSLIVKLLTDVIMIVHTRSSAVLIGFEQVRSSNEVNVLSSPKKIYHSLRSIAFVRRGPQFTGPLHELCYFVSLAYSDNFDYYPRRLSIAATTNSDMLVTVLASSINSYSLTSK